MDLLAEGSGDTDAQQSEADAGHLAAADCFHGAYLVETLGVGSGMPIRNV